MLKILHTADVHLGARFSGLGSQGAAQREQLRATFVSVVGVAVTEGVDVLLIAGDLFDSNQQPERNVELVIEQFNALAERNMAVCLIPGTHDCLDGSSIYRKVDFERRCPNLKVFTEEELSCEEYPEKGLTVYGKPNVSNRSYVSPLKGVRRMTDTRFHVAMAHGSFFIPERTAEDDHVFTAAEIEQSGMDYVALGHWHHAYACSTKPNAWYSGSPEWLPDGRGKGAVLLVSVSDEGRVSVESREVGVRDYDECTIEMSDVEGLDDLKRRIREEAGPNLVRKAVLSGLRAWGLIPDVGDLENELGGDFFHLSVVDRSHPRVADLAESALEGRLVTGRFVNLMKARIDASSGEEKEIAEDALQYGLALLENRGGV